jgi:ADP-ribose pyrophosphatase YjhB (NUDIX family)
MQTNYKKFSGHVRTRVSGIYIENSKILLLNHAGLYGHDLWLPPGGGTEFGSSLKENLSREFLEETGLSVQVGDFLLIHEFISELHTIEIFFSIDAAEGEMTLGYDPEFNSKNQIITALAMMSFDELNGLPPEHKHNLFSESMNEAKISGMSGYLIKQKNSIK